MGSQVAVAAEAGPDRFWDTYSRHYDGVYRLMPYRKLLWDAFEALELEPGMRVLDAGCGTGNFEHFVSEKNPPAVRIDAVDFSTEMLARAREKCAGLRNITFAQADLNARLPFEDATFDRIVSINVLFAVSDWDSTVRELLRILKPEGRMVLTSSMPDFRFGPLMADHVRRIGNIWGARRKWRAVLESIGTLATSSTAGAMRGSRAISRREKNGEYYSPDEPALERFLESQQPNGLGTFEIGRSMADQNFFATAVKACPLELAE
jgi:ubiquinone/menaquinone biosynthesis C-methylase UbiE